MRNNSQPQDSGEQQPNLLSPERSRYLWRRLWAYAGRRKYRWYLAIAGIVVSTLMLMVVYLLISPLLDVALPNGLNPATREAGLRQAAQILLAMVGLTLLGNLINRQSNAFVARLAQDMMVDLRADYAASLLRQGMTFYRKHEVGALLSIGMNDAEVISSFFMDELAGLLNYAAQFVFALGAMLYRSLPLSAGSIIFTGLLYGLSLRLIVPRTRRLAAAYSQQLGRVNAVLDETLSGVRDIQIFTQQERIIRRCRAALKTLGDYLVGARNLSYWNSSVFYIVDGLGQSLIYGLGVLVTILGLFRSGFTSGQLASFVGLFSNFTSPVKALGSAAIKVQSMLVAADRVFAVMDTPPEIQEKPDARDPGRLKGHIKFENVSFGYDPKDLLAWKLNSVNLEILPGEKVAFVGGSGSGKSTLMNLVARLYDPTGGRVTIDGLDARDMQINALRRNFGLVAQNVILFEGTVADNIRFGRPEADEQAVEAAARIGYVTEFVGKLDDGYDTALDAGGQGLSGGQKQRVCIARAALVDPAILLLDEATSALDAQSEAEVAKSLDALSRGRTTLVVTHRLNTIKNADKIVVLGADQFGFSVIKAVGTHDELIEKSAEYLTLYGKIRKKSILLPIGPRYDTTPALPTVIGLAQAYNAPVHLLDFGPLKTDGADKHFGVTVIPGQNVFSLNLAHKTRVDRVVQELKGEGLKVSVIEPPEGSADWVEATIRVVQTTDASHLVAVDNVMIPMDKLRADIRTIERKAAVEYILVSPLAAVE